MCTGTIMHVRLRWRNPAHLARTPLILNLYTVWKRRSRTKYSSRDDISQPLQEDSGEADTTMSGWFYESQWALYHQANQLLWTAVLCMRMFNADRINQETYFSNTVCTVANLYPITVCLPCNSGLLPNRAQSLTHRQYSVCSSWCECEVNRIERKW